ncbi:MAG: FAD-binding protein [Clostridia bacterium]
MLCSTFNLAGKSIKLFSCNTVVLGSGAAGYNAADRLWQYGQKDILMVTEGINRGTSRNTGSDKQTYYKLSLCGEDPDSVGTLAKDFFSGQCVDGDHALCEAALSAQCFLKLVELGVPFPRNRYGEYVGYKTDHDTMKRATSVGPYTSREMTQRLEQAVESKGIQVMDRLLAIRILKREEAVAGVLCLDLNAKDNASPYVAFSCTNLVFAVGGPAGIYEDSVYPLGHHGASGLAFRAGALGKNLTEWQYGLASLRPRWNVSGTYMQALPKMISTNDKGEDEREFLFDLGISKEEILTRLFLKGYQWPFDVRKTLNGSSLIDLLVYQEVCLRGRRVFLDYRENPLNEPINFSSLSQEAFRYLENAGACFGTPIERLCHMNQPAAAFFKEHGVDLETKRIEIALCAQHNNGGLDIDCWWQTSVAGLFAVGEVGASHGVYRPGGSALNAGQVGSTRAAQYIAAQCKEPPPPPIAFEQACAWQIQQEISFGERAFGAQSNVTHALQEARRRMSQTGAAIREKNSVVQALGEVQQELANFATSIRIRSPKELFKLHQLHDTLIAQQCYLTAIFDYLSLGGTSRGSALYTDPLGQKPHPNLPERFRFVLDNGERGDKVQLLSYHEDEGCTCFWRPVRPLPIQDDFFENIWRQYRENECIEIENHR